MIEAARRHNNSHVAPAGPQVSRCLFPSSTYPDTLRSLAASRSCLPAPFPTSRPTPNRFVSLLLVQAIRGKNSAKSDSRHRRLLHKVVGISYFNFHRACTAQRCKPRWEPRRLLQCRCPPGPAFVFPLLIFSYCARAVLALTKLAAAPLAAVVPVCVASPRSRTSSDDLTADIHDLCRQLSMQIYRY